jgi:hypothetical protein
MHSRIIYICSVSINRNYSIQANYPTSSITMKIASFFTSALVGAAAARDTIYLVNSYKGNEVSSGMAYYGDGHESTGGSRPDDYVDVVHGSNVHWEGQPVKGRFALLPDFGSQFNCNKALSAVVYPLHQTYLQMLVATKEILGLARARMGSILITATRVLDLVVNRGCCTLWMAGLLTLSTGAGPLIKVLRPELEPLAPRSSWCLVSSTTIYNVCGSIFVFWQ